jgi:hypothetical protein
MRLASCMLRAEPREKYALQKEHRKLPICPDLSRLCLIMLLLLENRRPLQHVSQHRKS